MTGSVCQTELSRLQRQPPGVLCNRGPDRQSSTTAFLLNVVAERKMLRFYDTVHSENKEGGPTSQLTLLNFNFADESQSGVTQMLLTMYQHMI